MGLLIKPTQGILDNAYVCNETIAQYFMQYIPLIYIDKSKNYYFIKTNKFKEIYDKRPFSVKLLELFKNL